MVSSVGRKKKDAYRVSFNISRYIRHLVLREAERLNWNEIDVLEKLVLSGIAAERLLAEGKIAYADFNEQVDAVRTEGKAIAEESENEN